jgi:hypothetical protein
MRRGATHLETSRVTVKRGHVVAYGGGENGEAADAG